ncbi:MAG TPA: two-component system response regulator [Xanthomonadales bacterium]|nr:two-component system response regulator [Xanthomonadales bacterium]
MIPGQIDALGDDPLGDTAASAGNHRSTQPEPERRRILVIEDDRTIAFLIDFLLEREGFEVLLARDGMEAMAVVNTLHPVNLILLDVMLPYHDGFELMALIRSREAWHDVPIVMLTGASREDDIVRALAAGAEDYILKPFKPSELVARLKRLLRRAA